MLINFFSNLNSPEQKSNVKQGKHTQPSIYFCLQLICVFSGMYSWLSRFSVVGPTKVNSVKSSVHRKVL